MRGVFTTFLLFEMNLSIQNFPYKPFQTVCRCFLSRHGVSVVSRFVLYVEVDSVDWWLLYVWLVRGPVHDTLQICMTHDWADWRNCVTSTSPTWRRTGGTEVPSTSPIWRRGWGTRKHIIQYSYYDNETAGEQFITFMVSHRSLITNWADGK